MLLCPLAAGTFQMGENPALGEGKDDERPAHEVTISRLFYIGAREVTQKEWREIMGAYPSGHVGDDNPVDSVSWNDAVKFIKKLNEREGHNRYRLPTEAEWEYAVRAGSRDRYF